MQEKDPTNIKKFWPNVNASPEAVLSFIDTMFMEPREGVASNALEDYRIERNRSDPTSMLPVFKEAK